jgi:hypothetical protein
MGRETGASTGEMTMAHTHTGYRKDTGYVRQRSEKVHALCAGKDRFGCDCYVGLCGEFVWSRDRDMYGDPINPNVRSSDDAQALKITCKKCQKLAK